MICVPIIGPGHHAARRQIQEAVRLGADMLELRLDLMQGPQTGRLVNASPLPVIATCRPARMQGGFDGAETKRFAVLHEACRAGAHYVDIEHDCIGAFAPAGRTKVILSYHNFVETPPDLERKIRKLASHQPAIIKFATLARRIQDNFRVLKLIGKFSGRHGVIGLCMGDDGLLSRLVNRRFGSMLTFAALAKGKQSAPGQLTLKRMRHTYGRIRPNRRTVLHAVIGHPLRHSLSPYLHNGLFEKYRLNRLYVPLDVQGDPVALIRECVRLGFRGFSVTIPHKPSVMRAADWIQKDAGALGAVNTLVVRGGKVRAYNTDAPAAVEAIGKRVRVRNRPVVVLGAGGAATALVGGLHAQGADVYIVNRTRRKAVAMARRFHCHVGGIDDIEAIRPAVIVNTTSVGMFPYTTRSPVPAKYLHRSMVIFDAVYNPIQTRLLRSAGRKGCRTIDGVEMFVGQAARQFQLWTGIAPDRQWMRDRMAAVL